MISAYVSPSLHLPLAAVLRFTSLVSSRQLSCNIHLHSVREVTTLACTSVSEEVTHGDGRKETGRRPGLALAWGLYPETRSPVPCWPVRGAWKTLWGPLAKKLHACPTIYIVSTEFSKIFRFLIFSDFFIIFLFLQLLIFNWDGGGGGGPIILPQACKNVLALLADCGWITVPFLFIHTSLPGL